MLKELLRRGTQALRNVRAPRPDPVQEIEAAIEAIEQAVVQIRRDLGIATPG